MLYRYQIISVHLDIISIGAGIFKLVGLYKMYNYHANGKVSKTLHTYLSKLAFPELFFCRTPLRDNKNDRGKICWLIFNNIFLIFVLSEFL